MYYLNKLESEKEFIVAYGFFPLVKGILFVVGSKRRFSRLFIYVFKHEKGTNIKNTKRLI